MAIIGVDVDLTVVDSDSGLFHYCNSMTGRNETHESVTARLGHVPYDFSKIYPEMTHSEIMEYWGCMFRYDEMEPIVGAVEALEKLSHDHEIIFVSVLTGNHYDSKMEFLQEHFPFAAGFIGTKQKHFARIDMLIDDRVDNLNNCSRFGIAPVLYESKYAQTAQPIDLHSTISSWNDLLADPRGVYTSLLHNRA